ncbi:transcription factor BTF3 homolog 4-like isoform X2 [Monodelphis domestica]|uniref:transcription factor BTF3 homolog 4-like isoform X2 n=1 Tax=Monodelphis domestica TaxID=13616 RepID=UPI0024E2125D|nr:transcription factor BTF3 homolog 4-like isoform X2 [Monodelphis domestica]
MNQEKLAKLQAQVWIGGKEMDMIKEEGTVIHFNNAKVQAALSANNFVITGHAEAKPISEMLPGILSQLGGDSLTSLGKLAEHFPWQALDSKAPKPEDIDEEEDEDVPDLVENFEEA